MIGKVAIERRALLNGTIRHDDPIEKELIVAIDTIELKCKILLVNITRHNKVYNSRLGVKFISQLKFYFKNYFH